MIEQHDPQPLSTWEAAAVVLAYLASAALVIVGGLGLWRWWSGSV